MTATLGRTAPQPDHRPEVGVDAALDEALERIGELAARLWAVRATHHPVPSRRRRAPRCGGCGQQMPCATLRAAG